MVLGAALYPGYSHLRDTISSLTNPTAPNLGLLNARFSIYNLAVLVFGIGEAVRSVSPPARAAAILVALTGFLGLILYFFPQGSMGSTTTTRLGLKGMSVCSFVSLAAVFVAGGRAAAGVAQEWSFGGLLQLMGAYDWGAGNMDPDNPSVWEAVGRDPNRFEFPPSPPPCPVSLQLLP